MFTRALVAFSVIEYFDSVISAFKALSVSAIDNDVSMTGRSYGG